jgi:hypothetical protein
VRTLTFLSFSNLSAPTRLGLFRPLPTNRSPPTATALHSLPAIRSHRPLSSPAKIIYSVRSLSARAAAIGRRGPRGGEARLGVGTEAARRRRELPGLDGLEPEGGASSSGSRRGPSCGSAAGSSYGETTNYSSICVPRERFNLGSHFSPVETDAPIVILKVPSCQGLALNPFIHYIAHPLIEYTFLVYCRLF